MTPKSLFEGIPGRVVLLDAAVAALSATLLPARMIPENLDVIGPVGSLLVAVGLLLTLAYRERLRAHFRPLALLSLAALLVLLLVQLGFVVAVAPYGPDAGTHRFLVGYAYTAQGSEWIGTLGPMSDAEYVGAVGDDRIRAMWGSSYLVTSVVYALSYMGFVLGAVLVLGASDLARPAPVAR